MDQHPSPVQGGGAEGVDGPPGLFVALQYCEMILILIHSLWVAVQTEVNVIGSGVAEGHVTSSKMATRIATILNFTQN